MVKFSKNWHWNEVEFAWTDTSTPFVFANFPVSSLGSTPTVGHFRVTVHASDRSIQSFPNVAYGQVLFWSITIDQESDPRDTGGFDGDVVLRGAVRPKLKAFVPPHEGQANWSNAGWDSMRTESQGMRKALPGEGGIFVNAAPHGSVPSTHNPYIWIGVRALVMVPPAP